MLARRPHDAIPPRLAHEAVHCRSGHAPALEGRLKYDDPVCEFLPEFAPRARDVTVRHLLHHPSGLADYEELLLEAGTLDEDYPRSLKRGASRYEPSPEDVLTLVCGRMLRFAPGDEWEYGNSGYMALAQLVARASGRPFSDFPKRTSSGRSAWRSRLYAAARPKVPSNPLSYTREGAAFRDEDRARPLAAV